MSRYPWIIAKPPERKGRGAPKGFREAPPRERPRKGFRDDPCHRCGFAPVGFRKRCAACLAPIAEYGVLIILVAAAWAVYLSAGR